MLLKKQIIKAGKKKFASMVQAFILQASNQPNEKVLSIYNSFRNEWDRYVRKVNTRNGEMILSYDVWDREWKDNGYKKYITIPIPKQLPEEERAKMLEMKTELIRLVYIIEGKTEHQRQRRELFYKTLFLKMRIKLWIKSFFPKKEKQFTHQMKVV
ncbi:MAG: hypothetical protein V4549_18145 [Bacteroidota bacterium]